MTYFGRYKKPDGTWIQWLKFPGHDDALRHCGRMAAGREYELLNEENYNLKYGEKPGLQETDSTDAFQRLTGKLEESRRVENLEEDKPQEEQREERGPGRPRIERPSKEMLQRLYIDEGKSLRAIAKELNLCRDLIHASLREYGIKTRPTFRESKLSRYPLTYLKERVRALGYERAARDLGVGSSTLCFYVKRR